MSPVSGRWWASSSPRCSPSCGSTTGWSRLRTRADDGWATIDVQLRRRYDLIPNLVETVKGYAAHERELFERVTEARSRGDSRRRRGRAGQRRERRDRRARQADGGRRGLPAARGRSAVPRAAGRAGRHRVEDRLRPAVLQRPGAAAEHRDRHVPIEPRRARVRIRGAAVLRHRRPDRRPRRRRSTSGRGRSA